MGWVVNATLRPLYPRERLGTHCIGDWVGPRAGLEGCEQSCPYRDSIPAPSRPSKVATGWLIPAHYLLDSKQNVAEEIIPCV